MNIYIHISSSTTHHPTNSCAQIPHVFIMKYNTHATQCWALGTKHRQKQVTQTLQNHAHGHNMIKTSLIDTISANRKSQMPKLNPILRNPTRSNHTPSSNVQDCDIKVLSIKCNTNQLPKLQKYNTRTHKNAPQQSMENSTTK